MRTRTVVLVALLLACAPLHAQKFKRLALTPPMGWNSWNKFGCDVSEQLIRGMADAMVSSGMKDVGYQYIVIDDCWHGTRDSLGFIGPDPVRFPSGMKALADYIHAKGLKFGIYSCAGNKTCAGHPGSRGREYQDACTYARWGVDYLKYDWCNTEGLSAVGAYTTMRDALFAAGRPVVFSLCEWGTNKPWEWGAEVGHLWRTTGDITACFDCVVDHGTWSSWGVMKIVEMREGIRRYAGPDHWNDPDMLEVGNGMTAGEDRAHFTVWCMLAAPLMAGNDLGTMNRQTREILTNGEVIAVDQDSAGIQGFRYDVRDSIEVWTKPLVRGDWAVCFLNRARAQRTVTFDWAAHAIADDLTGRVLDARTVTYTVRDLWNHRDLGTTRETFTAAVPPRDVVLVRLGKR